MTLWWNPVFLKIYLKNVKIEQSVNAPEKQGFEDKGLWSAAVGKARGASFWFIYKRTGASMYFVSIYVNSVCVCVCVPEIPPLKTSLRKMSRVYVRRDSERSPAVVLGKDSLGMPVGTAVDRYDRFWFLNERRHQADNWRCGSLFVNTGTRLRPVST